MKNVIFFFFIMIGGFSFGQHDQTFVDSLVSQKMAELELQGNPEYFFRKDYCEGNIQMFTMPDGTLCTSTSTYFSVYVFWKESDGIYKIQKFDNCSSYRPLPIGMQKQMAKLLKHIETIRYENVKPYESEKVNGNTFGNMAVKNCWKEYKFVFGGEAFEKRFNEFDLSNDSMDKNTNAEYNNALQLIEFDKEIADAIQNMEKNGRFLREN